MRFVRTADRLRPFPHPLHLHHRHVVAVVVVFDEEDGAIEWSQTSRLCQWQAIETRSTTLLNDGREDDEEVNPHHA